MLLWIVQIVICNSSWLINICWYRLTIKWTSHGRTIILGWRILQIYFLFHTNNVYLPLWFTIYILKFMNIKLRHFLLFLSKEVDYLWLLIFHYWGIIPSWRGWVVHEWLNIWVITRRWRYGWCRTSCNKVYNVYLLQCIHTLYMYIKHSFPLTNEAFFTFIASYTSFSK